MSDKPEYHFGELKRSMLATDPLQQFIKWHQAMQQVNESDANNMILSTVSTELQPSARVVLLKYYDERGFIFFSNYQSRKGIDIDLNPKVALLFWWQAHEQQVRIEGTVTKCDQALSDNYFQLRPRGSQLATMVSRQSQILTSGNELLEAYERAKNQYQHQAIPRPHYWGGYVVKPLYYEFWQGRPYRLHDRFSYRWLEDRWHIERLYP